MSATVDPDLGLPTNPPVRTKAWINGSGETETQEWSGERTDCEAKYEELKALGSAGGNISQVVFANSGGRCRITATLGASSTGSQLGDDIKQVEEIYAVDVIKDVSASPCFIDPAFAGLDLTDDEVAAVRAAVRNDLKEADITGWGAWNNGQKQLRYHMLHGCETYYETGYVARQSLYGVKTSVIKASFVGINLVADGTTGRQASPVTEFTTAMANLIGDLPAGEWLYRPPQAEHLGKGKWRVTKEWHWSESWSIIYGGTWGL